MTKWFLKKKGDWARPGFEPGTSRTRSENHTPRPTSHAYMDDDYGFPSGNMPASRLTFIEHVSLINQFCPYTIGTISFSTLILFTSYLYERIF